MLFFCSKRGCFHQAGLDKILNYTKLYEIRRRMFSMIIILSQCSFWDLKNMSEGDTRLLWPHVKWVKQPIIHTPPFLVSDHLTHCKLVPGNRTNYQSQSRSPCTICQWHWDLGWSCPCLSVAGPGIWWLWPRVCTRGPGLARQMSAACDSLAMAEHQGRARPEQAARAQHRVCAGDQGPGWWPLQLHSDPRSRHSDQAHGARHNNTALQRDRGPRLRDIGCVVTRESPGMSRSAKCDMSWCVVASV